MCMIPLSISSVDIEDNYYNGVTFGCRCYISHERVACVLYFSQLSYHVYS